MSVILIQSTGLAQPYVVRSQQYSTEIINFERSPPNLLLNKSITTTCYTVLQILNGHAQTVARNREPDQLNTVVAENLARAS